MSIDEKFLLERTLKEAEMRRREAETIQRIMGTLMEIVDVDRFWHKLDEAMTYICETIGASYGVVSVSVEPDNEMFTIKSVAGLPRDQFVGKKYPGSDPVNRTVLQERLPRVEDFGPSVEGSICQGIFLLHTKNVPDKVGLIPFDLAGGQHAVMALFVDTVHDVRESLCIHDELSILARVVPQIATAFENCQLYTERQQVLRDRNAWFEDVSHQLIAPLSGLQADADRLIRFFDQWERERIINQLKAIQGVSRWAARLTRNFDWAVRTGSISAGVSTMRWVRLKSFLIGCAIDVQGLAATKGIRVHVHESVDESWEVRIDRMRLNQAVVNLLDNAVKYANNGTEVRVGAALTHSELRINITDYGIPLGQEDTERIFERGYRTVVAKRKVVVGTGIGLPIAREIVRLHGGDIVVGPSTFNQNWNAHEVTFTITLPRAALRRRD